MTTKLSTTTSAVCNWRCTSLKHGVQNCTQLTNRGNILIFVPKYMFETNLYSCFIFRINLRVLKQKKCDEVWSNKKKECVQRSKVFPADKNSVLHLQICETQTLIYFSHKVAGFMNFLWNFPVGNSVMHWRIRIFLDVSDSTLYSHCNQVSGLILVEIVVIITYLFTVKYCSDNCAVAKEYCVL
jgi:hypothetical protein